MKTWKKYKLTVRNTILDTSRRRKDLKYWRDDMFANTIIYILPLSLIAFIPSLIWTLESKFYTLIIVDIISISMAIIIGLKKGIKIQTRKQLFIGTFYFLSFFLTYFVGLNSTLYLLAICFLATFMYRFKNQYSPALFNVYISIIYIALYHLSLTPEHTRNFRLIELYAVFSNLIFLSFLVCSLVPKLFTGLYGSFRKNIRHTQKIEIQNETLKEITWIQSHVVRAPLSRLMGITNLLKDDDITEEEKTFFINNIVVSCNELDEIVKEIVTKSESIRRPVKKHLKKI